MSADFGILVPPANPQALARAVTGLLLDPERRAEMSAAARRRAEERFSLTRLAADIERLYADLLGNGHRTD